MLLLNFLINLVSKLLNCLVFVSIGKSEKGGVIGRSNMSFNRLSGKTSGKGAGIKNENAKIKYKKSK